jgi:ORF6N domain-containing protein
MKPIPHQPEEFLSRIHFIRGQRVMLDSDLAEVYGVSTKRLNEQVRRNKRRFPLEFMFQLTDGEWENLRSQFATTNLAMRRTPPYVFTEHGAVMAASVLNTGAAVQASIFVVKAFVQLRKMASVYLELEKQSGQQSEQIRGILEVLRQFVQTGNPERRPIGFTRKDEE